MPTLINDSGLRFGVFAGRVPPAALTATLVVKGAFALRPNGPAEIIPEEEQPHLDGDKAWDDDPSRGLRSASDFAPFKPGTDLLLAGHCHAPGGRPVPFTQVSFGVANFRKPAVVIGDRRLKSALGGTSTGEPEPFTSLPLDWSRTWGGLDVPENPVGRGKQELTRPDGSRMRLAANVESVEQATSASGVFGRRMGFGPIDPAWAERMSRVGTYDAKWLAERWPWYPDDFDWRFFSAAPPDQYLHQIYLKGDEALEFVHLHPEHAVLASRLPGLYARCFIRVRRGVDLEFREVPMRIDTLFADLDASQVVLTWRGVTPVDTLKLKEFEDYFVILEPLAAPSGRSLDDYRLKHEARLREVAAEFELEPVILEPMVMPTLTPVSTAWAEQLDKAAKKLRDAAQVEAPVPPPAIGPLGTPLAPLKLPPPPKVTSIADATALAAADFAALDAHAPGFSAKYPPPDFSEFAADAALFAAFNGITDMEMDDAEDEPWTRKSVIEHLAIGGRFDNEDLSELDLSGLDLSGAGFRGATLEATNLAGAGLVGADFRKAAMAGAILDGARCERADFSGADMAEVSAASAAFDGIQGEASDWAEARLAGATFTGAGLVAASFGAADLAGAKFDGVDAAGADFAGATLTGADFRGATLTSADMDGADLSGGTLEGARAGNLRASKAILTGVNAREALLDEAVIEESDLTNVDFRGARLRRALLVGSRLDKVLLALADCRQARFDDMHAHDATFVGVNLFRASFERADLTRATFLDCNLYQAETWDAVLVREQLKECNLKGSKLAR